ncbi:MAG TPA: TetR/AcrR family transcriptional regulator [Candidatus Cloacimonadota bacterium]|nr:TetR/AcrR family transcriptional regulator [Candidatus Cloacimonadota bacterium]HPT72259.1 TetR/AcrR family transcriptional regulator [Candidatus Cloacimonadota bacterium]
MNARRIREKARHREEIITAAEKVFFKRGYDGTTLDEIGKVAEFSRRTLYTYFKSKDDLYLAVHLRYNRMKIENLEKKMNEAKTGYDKIYAFGEEYFKFFKAYPEYLRFQLYMDVQGLDFDQVQESTLKEFSDVNEKGYILVSEAIQLGQKDGTVKKDENPIIFISYLFYGLRTMANLSILHADSFYVFADNQITPEEFYCGFLNRLLGTVAQKQKK